MEKVVADSDFVGEIFGYTRISVDIEREEDVNTSIENQISVINDFVFKNFPKCSLKIYKDRDRSGYTFEQREEYQKMRVDLLDGKSKILIVKDLSRFARRTSYGLGEFERLIESGVRIISIMDNIDYPTKPNDWLLIQFHFMYNEMPVTETSRKVKIVVSDRQKKGDWICAAPYGYVLSEKKNRQFDVVPDEAQIVNKIFSLYNDGWGYKKIANLLTEKHIPTPRTKEKERAEAEGEPYSRKYNSAWSTATIQGILRNDFYIGTLRQHKYTRKKINGKEIRVPEDESFVFEKNHEAIVDDKTFLYAKENLKQRSRANYRGIKKYDTAFSGFLLCGDCGGPMFSMSRSDIPAAYRCSTYHKRGTKGCESHHTRVDFLTGVLKDYIRMVKQNSEKMIAELEGSIASEKKVVRDSDKLIKQLENSLYRAKEELKQTTKQRISDIAKNPDDADIISETYEAIETELKNKMRGLTEQMKSATDERNNIVEINRVAKTVFDVFDSILEKDKLGKMDIGLIVEKITVYKGDMIDIKLKPDIEQLLKIGTLPTREETVNFNFDSIGSAFSTNYIYKSANRSTKAYTVNVVCEGDPLEIYTDREGEVIFKKYSPIGELASFAAQYAETLHKTCSLSVVICDRDAVIACSGVPKKEYADHRLSSELESIIEGRNLYVWHEGDEKIPVISDGGSHFVSCAMPIMSEGDIIGCVASLCSNTAERPSEQSMTDIESKLILTAAGFLGKQLES
ncbi:MAG: recombinase family protein [Clostridia bacterium]|nr:recombinase family protein [Clostridia bacterium]